LAADWKVYQYLAEVLVATDGNVRVTQVDTEFVFTGDVRNTRLSQTIIEYINDILTRNVFLTQIIIEVAYKPAHIAGNSNDYLDEFAESDFTW